MGLNILIDFDGTCVTHSHPRIGKEIGAVPVLKELVANGHNLILFTMRGSGKLSMDKFGRDGLKDAVDWFKSHDIPLFGIQTHPTQKHWTNSPKAHGDLIIDDTALGMPLLFDPQISKGAYVDWTKTREMLIEIGAIKINDESKTNN